MKSFLKWLLAALLIALSIFIFLPGPIDAIGWNPEPIPALTGKYEKNNLLNNLSKNFSGLCKGCEDIAIDSFGNIYGGEESGQIVKFSNGERSIFVDTHGRPLGLDFDRDGNLIVADAKKGLLSIDINRNINLLSTGFNGLPYHLTDDVEVGDDGLIYFTDASSKFSVEHHMLDLLEHRGHGRLLSYNRNTNETKLLLDGLQFANGVAVSRDTSFVLINETGNFQVSKYWLKGDKQGQSEVLIGDLPGYPDGISRGKDGIYWLTLVAPRQQAIENLMPKPWLRNQLMKLPASFTEPKPTYYGMVLGIDDQGNIRYNFQDESPNLLMITSVQQFGTKLYMGSLVDDGIGVLDLSAMPQ